MGRKKKELSPAQKARAALMEKHGARGRRNANLWLVQCWRTGGDLVFSGDARAEHYYACEGDATVADASYVVEPQLIAVEGRSFEIVFDARVVYRDGRIEFRRVGSKAPTPDGEDEVAFRAHVDAAARLGGTYQAVRLHDLDLLRQRTANWRRMLRFLRATKHHPLGMVESDVRLRFEQRGSTTLGRLLDTLTVHEEPLVVAAVARLLLKRVLASDLDRAPLSRGTTLKLEVSA
ncbi:hypothetical protein [Lysobacter xanthus]